MGLVGQQVFGSKRQYPVGCAATMVNKVNPALHACLLVSTA
jgi:hypothetical protein